MNYDFLQIEDESNEFDAQVAVGDFLERRYKIPFSETSKNYGGVVKDLGLSGNPVQDYATIKSDRDAFAERGLRLGKRFNQGFIEKTARGGAASLSKIGYGIAASAVDAAALLPEKKDFGGYKEMRSAADFLRDLGRSSSEAYGTDIPFERSFGGQLVGGASSLATMAAVPQTIPFLLFDEATGFVEDTFGQKISEMDDEQRGRAELTRLLYTAAAVPAERLGLGKITQGVFAGSVPKKKVLHTLEAALTEGSTEGLQGRLLSAFTKYVAGADVEVFEANTLSDMVKEFVTSDDFLVGAVLGGGLRGGLEVAEPLANNQLGRQRAMIEAEIDRNLGALDAAGISPELKNLRRYLEPISGATGMDWKIVNMAYDDAEVREEFADEPELAEIALAAKHGDESAQAEYIKRTSMPAISELEVEADLSTEEAETLRELQARESDGFQQAMYPDAFDAEPIPAETPQAVQAEAVRDMIDFIRARQLDGSTIEESDQVRTFADQLNEMRDQGISESQIDAFAFSRIRAAGLDPKDPANTPDRLGIFGRNVAEFRKGVFRDVSTIYRGADPLDVVEESAEGFLKRMVEGGELTYIDVAAWRDAFGDKTGDSEIELLEWFSDQVKAWMVGKSASLERQELMPSSFRRFLSQMFEYFRHVFARAAQLKGMDRRGELDPQFKAALERGASLDENFLMDYFDQQNAARATADFESSGDSLLDAIGGFKGIPRPDIYPAMRGELETVWEAFGKDWKRYPKTEKSLDQIAEMLRYKGFPQMLEPNDVIEGLLSVARGEEVRGSDSFESQVSFSMRLNKNANLQSESALNKEVKLPISSFQSAPDKSSDIEEYPAWQSARKSNSLKNFENYRRIRAESEALRAEAEMLARFWTNNDHRGLSFEEQAKFNAALGSTEPVELTIGKSFPYRGKIVRIMKIDKSSGDAYFELESGNIVKDPISWLERNSRYWKLYKAKIDKLIEVEAEFETIDLEDAQRIENEELKRTLERKRLDSLKGVFEQMYEAQDAENRAAAKFFISKVWNAYGSHDEAFQYGRTDSKSEKEIAKAVSSPGMKVSARWDGETLVFSGKNGSIEIRDTKTNRPYLRATKAESQGKKRGGGSQLYQAALDWIHNNGKRVKDDPAGITTINQIRRTSNFFASAIRWGTTKHLKPHKEQGIGAWSQKDDASNISALASREMENAFSVFPEARALTFSFEDATFSNENGELLSAEFFENIISGGKGGIGLSTLQRAIITKSAIEAFQRGEAESALSSASSKIGESLTGISYALRPLGQSEAAAAESTARERTPEERILAQKLRDFRTDNWLTQEQKDKINAAPADRRAKKRKEFQKDFKRELAILQTKAVESRKRQRLQQSAERKLAAAEERRLLFIKTLHEQGEDVTAKLEQLDGIRRTLPTAVRHRLGGDVEVSRRKTRMGRQNEINRRLVRAQDLAKGHEASRRKAWLRRTLKRFGTERGDKLQGLSRELTMEVRDRLRVALYAANSQTPEDVINRMQKPVGMKQSAFEETARDFVGLLTPEARDYGRIEAAYFAVQDLLREGKYRMDQFREDRKLKLDELASTAKASALRGERAKNDVEIEQSEQESPPAVRAGRIAGNYLASWVDGFENIIRRIDGEREGPLWKELFADPEEGIDAATNRTNSYIMDAGEMLLDGLSRAFPDMVNAKGEPNVSAITKKLLSWEAHPKKNEKTGIEMSDRETGKIRDQPLSIMEAITVKLLLRQPGSHPTFFVQHGVQDIKAFERAVDTYIGPDGLRFIDEVVTPFFDGAFYQLNEVHKRVEGYELDPVENYFPFIREIVGADQKDPNAGNPFAPFDANASTASIDKGSLKTRSEGVTLPFKFRSTLSVLQNAVRTNANYIGKAGIEKKFRRLITDPDFRRALRQRFGHGGVTLFTDAAQTFIAGRMPQQKWGAWMDQVRSRMITGVLAAKPKIMLTQLTSIPAGMVDMDAGDWVDGVMEILSDPARKWGELAATPAIRHRMSQSQAQETISSLNRLSGIGLGAGWGAKLESAIRYSMYLIKAGDIVGASLSAGPVYFKTKADALKSGKGEAAARLEAEAAFSRSVNRSQQSPHLHTRPQAYQQNQYLRLLYAFRSAPMQYQSEVNAAIREFVLARAEKDMSKAQKKAIYLQSAKAFFVYHLLLPQLFYAVNNALTGFWLDDEDKAIDYWKGAGLTLLLGNFAAIPIAGDTLYASAAKFFNAPAFRPTVAPIGAAEIAEMATKAPNILTGDAEERLAAAAALANFTGLPVETVVNQAKHFSEFIESGDVDDGLKMMGWSPFIFE